MGKRLNALIDETVIEDLLVELTKDAISKLHVRNDSDVLNLSAADFDKEWEGTKDEFRELVNRVSYRLGLKVSANP